MTSDPWTLHASLACPSCHVVGKVVRFEREDDGYQCCDDEHLDDVDPYTCVECGQTFADTGQVGDVKEYRVQYMRLVEGRPFEPPKPKEPVKSKVDFSAYDSVLKDYYRKPVEFTAAAPQRFTVDDITFKDCTFETATAPKPAIPFHRSNAAWNFPVQRSKVLPTGDIVTDLGGSATVQFKDNSDPPWTSWLFDADTGAKTICIGYRTRQYHWNLATDEVTEK